MFERGIKRIECSNVRKRNERLNTIDYFVERKAKKNKVVRQLVLRIDPIKEKNKLVFQIGTSNGKVCQNVSIYDKSTSCTMAAVLFT